MKYIQTNAATIISEQPFPNISLNFLQQEITEGIAGVANGILCALNNITTLNPTVPYQLQGVGFSLVGSTYSISAGYIYYANELFYSQPGSFPTGGGASFSAVIVDYYDPSINPLQFSDYTTYQNVHDYRYLQWNQSGGGLFTSLQVVYSVDIAQQVINGTNGITTQLTGLSSSVSTLLTDNTLSAWTGVSLGLGWTVGAVSPASRVDGLGRVYLRGSAVAGVSSTSFIGTVAVGSAPAVLQRFTTCTSTSTYVPGQFQIVSAGGITIVSATLSAGDVWYLDGITYLNS